MKVLDKQKQLKDKADKILENKRLVRAYVRSEITLEQLNESGVKLAMPL